MSVIIENHIPAPVLRTGRPIKYPFEDMKVGDSFALDGTMTVHSVRSSARSFSKKSGWKFVVRKDKARCWRIA